MRRVEIIGGGLAGLALGIALRRNGVPAIVHEAGRYPRHRVCGEFITSLDRATRETLQLEDILQRGRVAHSVAWCENGKPDILHRLPEPAVCLSRHALDEALAARFTQLGGVLRTGVREECIDEPGRVHACGRPAATSSAWTGLKQHFRGLAIRHDLEVHFGRGGYIGLTRTEDDKVNVCGLLHRDAADLTGSLASVAEQTGLKDLSARLRAAEPVAGSFCAVAGLDYRRHSPDDGLLRVGDRSAMIPPFTGHGMTIALQSAVVAAPAITAWSRGEVDWAEACSAAMRAQRDRFGSRLRTARILHPLVLRAGARSLARSLHGLGILPVALLYRLMH